jgi:hypothetical protein
MYMKTTRLSIVAIVAALSLVSVSTLAAPALAYKDHDYDDHKDLKQFNYCVKHHGGGDISGYNLHKCGEKYLERV